MLLNQLELQTLCLKEEALEDLTAQVINQLNGIEEPCLRYATARALKYVIDIAVDDCGAAAETFGEVQDLGSDGKEFQCDGLTFIRQFFLDYDYESNATDVDGKPVFIKKHQQRLKDLEDIVAHYKQKVLEDKAAIKLAHPNMKPTLARVTFRWLTGFERIGQK